MDQSTQGIWDWPARLHSILGLYMNSDPVDHLGSGQSA